MGGCRGAARTKLVSRDVAVAQADDTEDKRDEGELVEGVKVEQRRGGEACEGEGGPKGGHCDEDEHNPKVAVLVGEWKDGTE